MKKTPETDFEKGLANFAELLSHYFETTDALFAAIAFVGIFFLPAAGKDASSLFGYAVLLAIGYAYRSIYRGTPEVLFEAEAVDRKKLAFFVAVSAATSWFVWHFLSVNGFRDSAFLVTILSMALWCALALRLQTDLFHKKTKPAKR